MSESINNNNNLENKYQYISSELQQYDTDNDGYLSVFEIESIEDDEGIEILSQDLELQTNYETVSEENTKNQEAEETNTETQISNLESLLDKAKENQGIIGKAWNGIKNITGLGSSTNKCEQAIENFKNGVITYDEAETIISNFSDKQDNSVNLAANIATGITTTLVIGSAALTGGLSLGVIAAAAGVGAATKAGLKFADRATNKVEGDALDAKQIVKDSLSGAVDGAVSVATMGIGTAAVTGKTVAEQTIKQTVIQGVKAGAEAGAISGAVTGASDYTIEAVLEEDVDFSVIDLAKTTAANAAGGAVAGGIMGGISSGIQYKNVSNTIAKRQAHHNELSEDTITELTDQAAALNKKYESNIEEAKQQIIEEFDNLDSVNEVTGRAKSEDSVFEKLATKYEDGKLTSTAEDACLDAIGDAYGTRVQIKSLTQEQSQSIIEDSLSGTGITYEQFISYLNGDKTGLDETAIETIEQSSKTIINSLKEAQTDEVFQKLLEGIDDGSITITELNNYGNEISSYFTPKQISQLADTYYNKTGQALDIVTEIDDSYLGTGSKVSLDEKGNVTVTSEISVIKEKGASKDSGYTSSQMNVEHKLSDGTTGKGELQIRGTQVNEFADVEHIPYDIKHGKILESDTEYSQIFSLIKDMSGENYKSYNTYLTKVYNWLRLKELGIETAEPSINAIMQNSGLSQESLNILSREGLINLSNSIKH